MQCNRLHGNFFLILLLSCLFLSTASAAAGEPGIDFNSLPAKGTVTMIDLGAKSCIPCKMMAPILEKLEKQYQGKAAIVFIDVWQNREQAARFGIRSIPTQIFFDETGKEVYRHAGFLAEEKIVEMLSRLGVGPK
jgi:thioredoxin 1